MTGSWPGQQEAFLPCGEDVDGTGHMGLVHTGAGSTPQDAHTGDGLMRSSTSAHVGQRTWFCPGIRSCVRGQVGCWKEAGRSAGEEYDFLLLLSPSGAGMGHRGRQGCWAPTHILFIVRDAKEMLICSQELGRGRDSKNTFQSSDAIFRIP